MEVVVPVVQDFHFDSTSSSPYVTAPSSPKRFGDPFDYYRHYTSAPTSPTRVAAILAASSSVPFDWEETPGTPKSKSRVSSETIDSDDFAFDFSGQLDKGGLPPPLTTADELFEEGKIRPLKPPPRLYCPVNDERSSLSSSPRSPKSPNKSCWSPRRRARGRTETLDDPFTVAMVEATRDSRASRSRKGSRSLSPLRDGAVEGRRGGIPQKSPNSSATARNSSASSSDVKNGGGRKWRLRDLLLFRSASEGRATGNRSKDPLRKFTIQPSSNSSSALLSRPVTSRLGAGGEDSRNSSFRSTDSHGSMRRGSGASVSPHEIHYTSNRAVSEELKKKTALPYRQSLFGCIRFNPAVRSIARGFDSYSFSSSSSSSRGRS